MPAHRVELPQGTLDLYSDIMFHLRSLLGAKPSKRSSIRSSAFISINRSKNTLVRV